MELQRKFSLLNVNRHGHSRDISHTGKHIRHEARPGIQTGRSVNQANKSDKGQASFQKTGSQGQNRQASRSGKAGECRPRESLAQVTKEWGPTATTTEDISRHVFW